MAINKFDFSCVAWNGDLDSICGLFSDLIENQINPATSKPKLQIQLDNFLETSDVLKKWQYTKSHHREAPVFKSYQENYKNFDNEDFSSLDKEVQEKGLLLPKGQVLFRGVCGDNQNDDWLRAVSTTLSPYIAVYHALKNEYLKPIKIYVIEVPKSSDTKAIIGPFGKDITFGHEYEVLTLFKCAPKVSKSIPLGTITLQLLRW